ncbi:MAG: NAD-dependent epimerase/dehydratase family protein [Massilia sp.]
MITGATGFIGQRLCERLSQDAVQNYLPFVRTAASAPTTGTGQLPAAVGDLLDAGTVRRALAGCDAVVHLAHGDRAVLATRRLIETSIEQGVRRFVHISTMSVHGPVPGPEASREDTARIGRYDHDYSDSKAEQEEIVKAAHGRGDLEVVILRPTIVYGPGSHFVRQIIAQARDGKVSLFDRGQGICNAVFVDDLCTAIDKALISRDAVGEAMFINGNEELSWQQFIKEFACMVAPTPEFINLSSDEARRYWAAHPPAPAPSLGERIRMKLKRLGGWTPEVAPWPALGRVERETFPIFFTNDKAKRLLDWAPQTDFSKGKALTRQWLDQSGMLA